LRAADTDRSTLNRNCERAQASAYVLRPLSMSEHSWLIV